MARMKPGNLQRRTTWALAGIVAVFVILQGTLAYLSLAEQEDDLVDQLVLAEARRLVTFLDRDEATGIRSIDLLALSPNFSGWLREPGGRTSPVPLPAYLEGMGEGPHQVTLPNAEYHVFVMPTAEGRLYVQYDASQNEEKVHQFGMYLFGLGVLCILAAFVLAGYVAAVVAAPIERLTRLLSNWAPQAMEGHAKGLADADDGDEETRLLDAFRRVQARFERSVAHEREFMSNARHEIMTPLTAVRTDLEMLALDIPPEQRARLQRALDGVDNIAGSLGLIHTLSVREAPSFEQVDLHACVDDAWRSLHGEDFAAHLAFVNAVANETQVVADRHALLTILRNLVRNAAEHAAPTTCTVSWTARGVEVADDGIGIAAEDLPFVFERYYRGRRLDAAGVAEASPAEAERYRSSLLATPPAAGERGLGLAIALQVAELNGWRLWVESPPGRGACFVLDLAERDHDRS